MNSDEKILKALEDLQAGQKALQSDVKELRVKVDNIELKTEAIQAYQLKAHDEIMEKVFESNEINAQEQKALEKRIEVLEEHAGIPHPDKN